jgi:hypothetical protein
MSVPGSLGRVLDRTAVQQLEVVLGDGINPPTAGSGPMRRVRR